MSTAAKVSGASAGSILSVLQKKSYTAGGFRWFSENYIPEKKDFLVAPIHKILNFKGILNISLWERLGKPVIDIDNPPACMNISLADLLGEEWKEIPDFGGQYTISNKGRVKRKSGWVFGSRSKIFFGEQIR